MRAILGFDWHNELLKLQPAAGCQVSVTIWSEERHLSRAVYSDSPVSFAKKLWPIGKAADHEPSVDEVEFSWKHPRVLCVIDDESQVGRDTERLSYNTVQQSRTSLTSRAGLG